MYIFVLENLMVKGLKCKDHPKSIKYSRVEQTYGSATLSLSDTIVKH